MTPTDEACSAPVYHLDQGKPRTDLLPFRALLAVAGVADYGVRKYGERNWEEHAEKWEWGKLFGSAMRHSWSWMLREDIDPESGHHHLAHAAWNVLALLELVLAGKGKDDRSVVQSGRGGQCA